MYKLAATPRPLTLAQKYFSTHVYATVKPVELKNPILVTGSHRSGSTWVGRTIAKSPRLTYFHEPFNVNASSKPWSLEFDLWFKHVPCESGVEHGIEKLFTPSLSQLIKRGIFEFDSVRDAIQLLRDNAFLFRHQITGSRALIKDPIALLSAEWLEKAIGARVVVMIRHPAAFAGSLKVKDWTFPFSHLLEQPRAIEKFFPDYREDIEHFSKNNKDIVDQAALLWSLLYSAVDEYKRLHPEWIFLRHKDVVQHPTSTFRDIYYQLGLDFTDKIRKEIEKETDSSVVRNWTDRLTEKEIRRVKERTEPVAKAFYSNDEW